MKYTYIGILIAFALSSGNIFGVQVQSTNVTVNTVVTTTVVETIPVILEITELHYDFAQERLRVTLEYRIEDEVVAVGWAVIAPDGPTKYNVSYFNDSMDKPVTASVPAEVLDSMGLTAGTDLVKALAGQLGALIANNAAPQQ